MYFDHAAADRRTRGEQAYKKLRTDIYNSVPTIHKKKVSNPKLAEYELALEHMGRMESKLEKQEAKLKEYQEFFKLMDKLLPYSGPVRLG